MFTVLRVHISVAILCEIVKMNVEVVTSLVQHGEAPIWNEKNRSLYYVSTFEALIFRWDSCSKKITSHQLDSQSVGFLVPIKKRPDTYILCKDRDVCLLKWDGATNNTGIVKTLLSVDQDKEFNQFNDGKVDAVGRLWAGTLTRNKDLSVASRGGSLYSLEDSFKICAEIKISCVSISNGMAWSSDNKVFFHIDSETRKVMKYSYNLTNGSIGQPRLLFDMDIYKHLKGLPDGMTIDAEDNLWIALYGGGAIVKVNSTSGELMLVRKLPATYVTSVAFGGPAYSILYVTTSRLKLSENDLPNEPHAGSVFAVHNLGVRGRPPEHFILKSVID